MFGGEHAGLVVENRTDIELLARVTPVLGLGPAREGPAKHQPSVATRILTVSCTAILGGFSESRDHASQSQVDQLALLQLQLDLRKIDQEEFDAMKAASESAFKHERELDRFDAKKDTRFDGSSIPSAVVEASRFLFYNVQVFFSPAAKGKHPQYKEGQVGRALPLLSQSRNRTALMVRSAGPLCCVGNVLGGVKVIVFFNTDGFTTVAREADALASIKAREEQLARGCLAPQVRGPRG
jgi:hypothetical protein